MTAEVAILNKQSVAMAADSAVTTGDQKIFNTVNKLFALSKWEPVGVMVYSSAEIMEVPVETVIKEFRRSLNRQSSEHINGYKNKFDEFLREDKSIFTDEARRRSLFLCAHDVARALVETAEKRLNSTLQGAVRWGHPTVDECRDALNDSINIFLEHVGGCKPVSVKHSTTVKKAIRTAIDGDLDETIKWLGEFYPIDDDCKERLKGLFIDHLFRETKIGGETGIVIAGFGEKDIYPSLRSVEFQCSAMGLHNSPDKASIDIEPYPFNKVAKIVPFAQRDVVDTLISGHDPHFEEVVKAYIEAFLDERKTQFLAEKRPNRAAARTVEQIKHDIVSEVENHLKDYAQLAFVNPLIQVVASMPKEELAILAEAMVNLTAIKRKASPDAETVGGPTDVAVISKGDGFIWIKRKHYFDPAFNPTFNSKYLEGAEKYEQ